MSVWVNGVLLCGISPPAVEGLLVAVGAADWRQSLILDGIGAGVGAVLGFRPQRLVLFLLLALLEDCGYMSRIAFIMDRIFRRFGLSGKSFIPMLIGLGCGVPAVQASRTIENDRDRKMTIMTTTFIPCSAKLPIIGLIAGDLLNIEPDQLKSVDRKQLTEQIKEKVHELYAKREAELGENITRELERVVLLKEVDTKWMDHIDAMDELKKGISLRSYGQKDPVVEYRIEGFDMFDEMNASIREETAKILLLAPFRKPGAEPPKEAPKREQVAKPISTSSDGTVAPATVKRQGKKIGRNDPCPCGSGKKYKNCCGR